MQFSANGRRSYWHSFLAAPLWVISSFAVMATSDNQLQSAQTPRTGNSRQITGRVIRDEGSAPVAEAEVTLLLPPEPGEETNHTVRPRLTKVVQADLDGNFTFDNLPPGIYRVWAQSEMLTSRHESLIGVRVELVANERRRKPVELRMRPGVALTAIVKSRATGRPIPNANVHIGSRGSHDDNFVTDDQGKFTFRPLVPRRWSVEARADGFARQLQSMILQRDADAEIEFFLEPGADLFGDVRDAAGEPIADVELAVRHPNEPEFFLHEATDEQGRFRLVSLPIDVPLELQMTKPGFRRKVQQVVVRKVNAPLVLTIEPRSDGGSLSGTIVDQAGRPIAGAELTNSGRRSGEMRIARTDEQGHFHLKEVQEGLSGYEVIVRARRFAPLRVEFAPASADKATHIEIALDPGHILKGEVQDESGEPIPGVTVYFGSGLWPFADGGKTQTDQRGRFEFDSLPEKCRFSFLKSGFSGIVNEELALDREPEILVKLSPAGTLTGRVLDEKTGQPIPRYRVRLSDSQLPQEKNLSSQIDADLVNPGQSFRSDDGRFEIRQMQLGLSVRIMIEADGYEPRVWDGVETRRADKTEMRDFALQPLDPASLITFSGRLRDARRKPVAGATLRLIAARNRGTDSRHKFPFTWDMIRSGKLAQESGVIKFLEGKTDAAGRFEFTGVPRNAEIELVWWGDALAAGFVDHLENLDDSDLTALEIDLPVPGKIHGTIDRSQLPDVGAIVVIGSDGLGETRKLLLQSGQNDFELNHLSPGSYTLKLLSQPRRAPQGRNRVEEQSVFSCEVTVDDGATTEVALPSE